MKLVMLLLCSSLVIAQTFPFPGPGQVSSSSTLPTPTFAPGTGTYSSPQTVTITFGGGGGGPTGCYATSNIAQGGTPGTCGSGWTTYTTAVTVSSSETLYAYSTEVGFTNSATGSAVYTITNITLNAGFNFRPSSGAVTDPSGYTWAGTPSGEQWPTSYTMNGTAVQTYGGFNLVIANTGTSIPTGSSSGVGTDPRLSGGSFYTSSVQNASFFIMTPGAGSHTVYLAIEGGLNQSTWRITDGYGTITGLATSTAGTGTSCSNATGTLTWVSGTNYAFTPDMVGNTITFNSSTYTVCSIASGVLTVYPNPGANTSLSWSYTSGTAAAPVGCSACTQTNVAIASGDVADANGTVTIPATWVSASSFGGTSLTATFTSNVVIIQWGLASGSNPFSALSSIYVQ